MQSIKDMKQIQAQNESMFTQIYKTIQSFVSPVSKKQNQIRKKQFRDLVIFSASILFFGYLSKTIEGLTTLDMNEAKQYLKEKGG